MNFDKIREMVAKDISIDKTELGDESARIPQLHNKYLNVFHDERLILHKMSADYKILRKNKWEWMTGKMSQELLDSLKWEPFQQRVMRQDLGLYLDADSDLTEQESKIALQTEKVEYLESLLKGISQRHWVIRNSIEWRKFTQGVV
jgi:Recombination, repair and ssDNA binding protein UvsY